MNIHTVISRVISVIFILNLAGCEVVNTIRMRQINSDVEPVVLSDNKIKLKSAFYGEKPYIYANVDGEEFLFLLDTGASFLIFMDTPKVRALALKRGFDLSMGGWGEQERSEAFQTEISRIDLGGVYFDNFKAAFIPVSKTHYYLRADEAIYDGVIGHDMMRHFTWEIDAKNNEIYISKSKFIPPKSAQYLEMETFFSKIFVNAKLALNDEFVANEEFIIDTGSRHYLKISDSYAARNGTEIASPKVRAADFGLSGMVEHDRATLPWIELGQLKINNIKTNLIPNDDDDDLWVIGNALMNQFKTVIDYHNDAFYLVPQGKFVTDYNLLGLELRKIRNGNFVVRYVFPNLPASTTGIKVGDVVTKINNMPSSTISLSQFNDLSSHVGKHHLCIERENRCFGLLAADIDGYSKVIN